MPDPHEQPEVRSERLVFISHSSKDLWVAKQVAREIEACGAKTFLDEAEIDIGDDFEEKILSFLDQADELVAVITPWALERPYIWAEIGACWGRRIPIIGLLHGITSSELQAKSEVPMLLKKRDLISLNEIETYLAQLRKRVNGKQWGEESNA